VGSFKTSRLDVRTSGFFTLARTAQTPSLAETATTTSRALAATMLSRAAGGTMSLMVVQAIILRSTAARRPNIQLLSVDRHSQSLTQSQAATGPILWSIFSISSSRIAPLI